MAKDDTRDILAMFAGILGFFLIWGGYSNYLSLKMYDPINVMIPVAVGIALIYFAYRQLRE
jgi:hypothetical protein